MHVIVNLVVLNFFLKDFLKLEIYLHLMFYLMPRKCNRESEENNICIH